MYKTIITDIDADTYGTHKIVAEFVEGHHVWRRDGELVTVVSADKPAGHLRAGMCLGSFEIPSPVVGDRFVIMLRVCACKHVGKQYHRLDPAAMPDWLAAHMPGLALTDVVIAQDKVVRTRKQEHLISVSSYNVSATCEVTDADAAACVLSRGIGRGRRFGFGLVLPLR